MKLDADGLISLTRRVHPRSYLRCTPWGHRATPLGMGFGETRFASPSNAFKLLYIAADLATAMAEAIVRDRFEGLDSRELTLSDLDGWGA